MEENLKKCFCQASYKPEDQLAEKVWVKLCSRNKRTALLRFWMFSSIGLISVVIFVPVFKMLLNDFAQSGFYEYVSLAFSSNGTITSYWKEFAFSIAESLPIMSILFSLGLFFIFFLSVRYVIKQIIKGQLTLSVFNI